MMMFILRLMPQLSAKKSYLAREYMVKVWEQYFEAGSYEQGSELVQARVRINNDFGITMKQTARIELGGSQAILTNTLPGAFWMVYHIFSDPAVLMDIRTELSTGIREEGDGTCIVDLSFVKHSCPILLSTFKEVMRFHSSNIAARIVMEDYLLDNKYFLKKGATLMIPAKVQHTSRHVWGDTLDEFNHKRFLRVPGTKSPHPVAFRGFGGGSTLCPGRHFASTEILMFAVLAALRFDLLPVSGQWTRPLTTKSPLVNALPLPDDDIEVSLQVRDGKKWDISFQGYARNMDIAAEDLATSE
jgi:hypothetical protein